MGRHKKLLGKVSSQTLICVSEGPSILKAKSKNELMWRQNKTKAKFVLDTFQEFKTDCHLLWFISFV